MNTPGAQFRKVTMQSAATATGNGTAAETLTPTSGAWLTLTLQVEGISGDTITFEGTIDGTNWIAVQFTNLNDGTEATTATADGLYRATVIGLVQVRARVSTYSAGTITVTGVLVA